LSYQRDYILGGLAFVEGNLAPEQNRHFLDPAIALTETYPPEISMQMVCAFKTDD